MLGLLAINWEPELRGRPDRHHCCVGADGQHLPDHRQQHGCPAGLPWCFLAALAGWMFIMGSIWWSYGQGLKGTDPSWQPVAHQTVLRNPGVLEEVGVITSSLETTGDHSANTLATQEMLQDNGWLKLSSTLPSYQQAGSSGTVYMEESEALAAGVPPWSPCSTRVASVARPSSRTGWTSSRSSTTRTMRSSRWPPWCRVRSPAVPGPPDHRHLTSRTSTST